ncbi:MAG: hypothetical protein IKV29_00690 [Alistipes sp.]|nr:hypothetical protein [Alistipes sp.]
MIRRISYTIAALIAMLSVACHHDIESTETPQSQIPEGWTEIEFTANTPLMTEVVVRGVDPDGIDVQNLTLFCFNDYGLYITHVEAELNPAIEVPSLSGTYKAIIPEDTRIVHFVANQNPNLYDASMFTNRTEDEIQDGMVGASGMIIYWSRFIFNSNDSFQRQLADANNGEGIKLIRNQAKVSIDNPTTNGYIDISGFVVANIHAYGTTAPYHPERRFPTDGTDFVWPGDDFVTLPNNRTKLSDITDVYSRMEEYIFEHENSLTDPVSVILKGRPNGSSEELYYRVAIIDEDGEQLMIRRNHHYKLHISGALTYGSKSFDEALISPATNNIWVAVEDWVNEVEYDGVILSVDQTSVVLGESEAGHSLELGYTITGESSLSEADKAEVSWMEGNTVAAHNFNHSFTVSGNTGRGKVTIQLLEMGDNAMLEGKLIVKKGRLHRTIDVVLIKTQSFTPVWAATQIYGGELGELATLKFTVPDNFPFFPFNVYVSVNSLDVRTATTGRVLPVVSRGEEGWYGVDNDFGYKYVYTVTEPGVQRLYLHSIITHEEGGIDEIMLEAEHFRTVTKQFHYASHRNSIAVDDLNTYSMSDVTDEPIYYRLVPRKINAPVEFDMLLSGIEEGKSTVGPMNAGQNDEFFLYSRAIDAAAESGDCQFYAIDDDYWQQSTNGRMVMFMPRNPNKTGDDKGRYTLHLKTNTSRSDDMIRIASNNLDSHSAHPDKVGQDYVGNTYRSFIFELATYRPFRFAAQVAIAGGAPVGTWNTSANMLTEPDAVDVLEWSYQPNQKVDINFEITSFIGSDGRSADPFGTSFEVYIDAPMLKIDESRLTPELRAKLKPHASIPGRFVYTVDASRDEERKTGSGESVKVVDGATLSQSGERKSLPFVTNSITSAGEIVISSQTEVCEFFEKRFRVTNRLVEGGIKYEVGATQHNVPRGEFVSFAVERTGVRIGSMNITADGRFQLNLRAEYDFSWGDDALLLSYIKGGEVYEARFDSLKELYDSVVNNNTAIVLRK